MIKSPRKPLNLERSDSPAAMPARPGRTNAAAPERPDQTRCHHAEEKRQRDQRERLARHVRHGSVREQAIERVEHERQRGQGSDAGVLDKNAARKDRDAAESLPGREWADERPRVPAACRNARNGRTRPTPRGHWAWGAGRVETRAPIRYLGSGGRSYAGKLEPGPIVEPAVEEQVGVIALGNVGVLILERGGEQSAEPNTARAAQATSRRLPEPGP